MTRSSKCSHLRLGDHLPSHFILVCPFSGSSHVDLSNLQRLIRVSGDDFLRCYEFAKIMGLYSDPM
jgi:hypothetical protein